MNNEDLLYINLDSLDDIIDNLSKYKNEVENEKSNLKYINNTVKSAWNELRQDDSQSYAMGMDENIEKLKDLVDHLERYIDTLINLRDEVESAKNNRFVQ